MSTTPARTDQATPQLPSPGPLVRVVLESERVRAAAAVAVILLGVPMLFVLGQLTGFDAERTPGLIPTVLSGLGALAIFEVWIYLRVRQHLRGGTVPPPFVWGVSGVVEVTVPTLLLLAAGRVFSTPVDALGTPVALLYFPLLALSVLRLSARLSAALGVVAAVQYWSAARFLYTASPAVASGALGFADHASVTVGLLLTGGACAVVAREARRRTERAIASAAERERLRTLFGQHTDPAVVEALLTDGEALEQGRRQHIVAMFLDVRGFTGFAEAREPEAVVAYLNDLFEIAVAAVTRHGGVVHQLLGDGLLALFGVPDPLPDDADRAVAASLETVAAVAEAVAAGTLPPTRLGIGLHAGEGLVGLVGPTARREFKVVGDAVNVASRVEQMNKDRGSTVLATAEVVGSLRRSVGAEDLGPVDVRGRRQQIQLYRLL